MNLRPRICYLLSLLRIHRQDCKHCNERATGGDDMLKRLEELHWRTQQHSLKNGDDGEISGVPRSKSPKS